MTMNRVILGIYITAKLCCYFQDPLNCIILFPASLWDSLFFSPLH